MKISEFVRTSLVAGAVAAALGAGSTAAAQTKSESGTMPVTADVTRNCTIETASIAFGSYDVNAAADLDKSGTLRVACTKGVRASITLNNGKNGDRTMTTAAGDKLSYQLTYNGAAWDANNPVTYTSTTRVASTLTVQGKIARGQDVSAGAYTDEVTATVNF